MAPASGGRRPSVPWTACAPSFAIRSKSFSASPPPARSDRLWGVRLRIPGFRSRFGVPVDEPAAFERLCTVVAALPADRPFGIHVHMASTMIGVGHWRDIAESAVVWGAAIEATTGRRVRALDLGGGYHPDDLAHLPFPEIVRFARKHLPSLAEVYIEPGRALTQATMAIVTSVLDVRRHQGTLHEVVVDACLAELPLVAVYPHRFFSPRQSSRGAGRPVARYASSAASAWRMTFSPPAWICRTT